MNALANHQPGDAGDAALRAERNRFVSFAFAAADLLLEVDREGVVRFATGAGRQLAGEAAEALAGRKLAQLLAEPDRRMVAHLLAELAGRTRLQPIAVTLEKTGCRALLGACRLAEAGQHYSFTLTRIVETAALTAPDGAPAARDGASGTLERDAFATTAGRLVASGEAGADGELSLFELVGLEAFQQRLDESAVERFLADTGAYLRAHSVGGDAAGRLADDKFGVIHGGGVSGDAMREHIRALARESDPKGGGIDVVRQSVALDSADLNDRDVANVLVYTIRTYAESRGGDFTIKSLSQGFQSLAKDTATKTLNFKRAVQSGAFDIVFQPIVDLAGRALHHYEVLSRFADGTSPFEMVTLAENVGLIEEFDLAVCRRAAEAIRAEAAAGRKVELAVNLSGRSLQKAPMVEAVRKALAPLGELRKRFLIEVTETSEIENLDLAEKVLQTLRGDGMRICLDDFGAGAASFRYVQALGVDFVKVDGAYIENILASRRDVAILKAMVTLCRELGVATIAERIETAQQADKLKTLGIVYGQGWLFGKPQAELPVQKPAPAAAFIDPAKVARRPAAAAAAGGARKPKPVNNWLKPREGF